MNTQSLLTPTQQRALSTYGELVTSQGFLPSTREFCEAMGYSSSSTSHAVLKKLQSYGYPCYCPCHRFSFLVSDPTK